MATASANQKSTVIRMEKQIMLDLLHQYPEFVERFLTYMLSHNIRMEADLVDHLSNSSEKHLARLLLLLANFGQESKPIPLIARMSQETLAEMIGTTRSRVSFFSIASESSASLITTAEACMSTIRWSASPLTTNCDIDVRSEDFPCEHEKCVQKIQRITQIFCAPMVG